MTKRIIVTTVVALAVLAAIFGYKFMGIRKAMASMASMKQPPTTVSATPVTVQTWPNSLTAVGTLASFRGVTLKSELAGTISEVPARSGAVVAKGELLVVLDTSVEEAQLAGLEAQARLADINLTRAKDLRSSSTNTQSELDTAEASCASARAARDQMAATIAKKRVVAPFAGRLGIVKVYPGQYLAGGDALVVLESTDPIYVDFSLPQQVLSLVKEGQATSLAVDAWPERSFAGAITAISPRVEEATRSIDLRATLPNPDGSLRPGMYARVGVLLPPTENARVIPSSAVVHNPYGETVYVIEEGLARQRFIKTGPQQGDLIQVLDGLKTGEQVITSGQIKLRNGIPVRVDNSAAPEANPAPKPHES
jgi:membrane fusion protein (multidrug efflux system)